jgi:hypothetical protein
VRLQPHQRLFYRYLFMGVGMVALLVGAQVLATRKLVRRYAAALEAYSEVFDGEPRPVPPAELLMLAEQLTAVEEQGEAVQLLRAFLEHPWMVARRTSSGMPHLGCLRRRTVARLTELLLRPGPDVPTADTIERLELTRRLCAFAHRISPLHGDLVTWSLHLERLLALGHVGSLEAWPAIDAALSMEENPAWILAGRIDRIPLLGEDGWPKSDPGPRAPFARAAMLSDYLVALEHPRVFPRFERGRADVRALLRLPAAR